MIKRKLAEQLGIICPKAKMAYESAIHAINAVEHDEELVHSAHYLQIPNELFIKRAVHDERLVYHAHSLRETIDLVAKANVKTWPKTKLPPAELRCMGLLNLAKRNGVEDENCRQNLLDHYRTLSEIAHHRALTDNLDGKNFASGMLTYVENNLIIILNIKKADASGRND